VLFSSALKVAQVDLASARSHMHQFQEISQANEAALAALNTTHDQYKADAETRIARHEVPFWFISQLLLIFSCSCTDGEQVIGREAWRLRRGTEPSQGESERSTADTRDGTDCVDKR